MASGRRFLVRRTETRHRLLAWVTACSCCSLTLWAGGQPAAPATPNPARSD
jgi:hypothetical protein